MVSSHDSLSPLPFIPPPPLAALAVQDTGSITSHASYNPSLIIIAALLAFVCLASTSIHLLLRFLSRTPPPSPSTNTTMPNTSTSDKDPKTILDSLPLFSLASSLSMLPKSSPDCAVCLSRFHPHDELRLLPACRHAFHSPCIDTWLRSTPSCPLCRSSIHQPPLSDTDSFRVEIGSVSRRRTEEASSPVVAASPAGAYSVGSSFEYRVEGEVEAVMERVRRRVEDVGSNSPPPPPPGAAVAEAAGGGDKGWLKEYVDKLVSSASSSFSSLALSSRRFDDGCSLEGDGGEGGSRSASYRWLQ